LAVQANPPWISGLHSEFVSTKRMYGSNRNLFNWVGQARYCI